MVGSAQAPLPKSDLRGGYVKAKFLCKTAAGAVYSSLMQAASQRSETPSRLAALKSNAPKLARILDRANAVEPCWLPEDLPDLLRHQWAAPIEFDLSSVRDENRDKALSAAVESDIRTFSDLLRHPSPPLDVLKLAKEFFKERAGRSSERHPEQQIAYVFYLLVILTASARLGTAISSLTGRDLARAVAWSLRQSWLQGEVREVFERWCGGGEGKD